MLGISAGATIILVAGIVMLSAGLNEAFYSPDATVKAFFEAITFAGDELFFIIAISFIYFGIDKRFGRRLVFGFLVNMHANQAAKALFQDPRPATNMGQEEGFGFPSGHTQSNVAIWGYTIVYTRHDVQFKHIIKVIGIALIVLVPLSRLVIGVHDLQDIIGGYVIGAIVLLGYTIVEDRVVPMVHLEWRLRLILGAAAWMTLWVATILALPASATDFGLVGGLLVGIAIGFPVEQEFVKFKLSELAPGKKILSGITGTLLTIATYVALSLAMGNITVAPWVFRMMRYAILGFLVAAVYPWLLGKMFKA